MTKRDLGASLSLAAGCLLLAASATSTRAEDLAWKFDSANRPSDVTTQSSAVTAPCVCLQRANDESEKLPLFDSRWDYTLLSEGWSFFVPKGFLLFLR